jgi:hypothetical protein
MRTLLVVAGAGAFLAGGAVAGTSQQSVAKSTAPLQRGASQGVRVAVYRSGSAVFDLRRTARTPRRLLTGPSGLMYGCLRAALRHGRWSVSGFERSGRFRHRLVLEGTHLLPPFDACELGGLYGHRWDDAFGTRNAVEIWLTASGRHYFNDRAAARDLAYFVRSGRAQRIRLSDDPRPALEALVERYRRRRRFVELRTPTDRSPEDAIGFWIGEQTIVFATTSSTKRRFYVVARRGTLKLPANNLGDLALVF